MTFHCLQGRLDHIDSTEVRVPVEIFMRTDAENRRGHQVDAAVDLLGAITGQSSGASRASGAEVGVQQVRVQIKGQTCQGLLDACPFAAGDEVRIVVASVDPADSPAELLAISRPSDRFIALRPHCVRGRRAHFLRARRRSAVVCALVTLLTFCFCWQGLARPLQALSWGLGLSVGFAALWAFIERRIYLENARLSAHLTEAVLTALGLPDSPSIDLNKTSRRQRQGDEPAGYGWTFYRY